MRTASRSESLLEPSLEAATDRLASLLTGAGDDLTDPSGGNLEFEGDLTPIPLGRRDAPSDVWAVDGGQATVADARCVQLVVTRASRVRWRDGRSVLEEEGDVRAWLLGLGQDRQTLASLGAPVDPSTAVDVNLLRDWGEWQAVERCVEEAERGALVLLDGDLQPDWRIPSIWLAGLLGRASERGACVAAVTKHSSLSRGGAPLLGQLEAEAEQRLGARATWWVPVARTRRDIDPGIQILVARLDPDARFSFRVDLPAGVDPEPALEALSALSDDAAFPGYPYPLSSADRLAACPGWLRAELWERVQQGLSEAGVPPEVRDRAFTDRHRLMERY